MNNVMLDLETMGNGCDAAIVAVGAVRFDENGVSDKFYEIVDLQSSIDAGLKMDAGTVLWWMGQSDSARSQLMRPGLSLERVLYLFAQWIGDDALVWGNGASFDNAILSNAYRKTALDQPWKFWNDRCYRTVKNMHPHIKMQRQGTYHCAVDDAESQALHLIEILAAQKS
jgi:exodeoxyribonuclease VIII